MPVKGISVAEPAVPDERTRDHADAIRRALELVGEEAAPTDFYYDDIRAKATGALAALVAEVERLTRERDELLAWKEARIENHPTDAEFYGR